MEVNVNREDGYVLAHVTGAIDNTTVQEFGRRVVSLVEQDANVLVDMSATVYINSDGLVRLLRLQQEIKKRSHQLVLFVPTPLVRSVFEATNLDNVLQVVDSRNIALDYVSAN
jgi:anti-anti-sigma factor